MTDIADKTQTNERVLQSWLHDTGKLLLEERERTQHLETALLEAERQVREMDSRNWLLAQTVDTLKQELREMALRCEQMQLELRNAQIALRQQPPAAAPTSPRPATITSAAANATPTVPPIAPAVAAPRIRPANQRTPTPGYISERSGRGVEAPPRRRR